MCSEIQYSVSTQCNAVNAIATAPTSSVATRSSVLASLSPNLASNSAEPLAGFTTRARPSAIPVAVASVKIRAHTPPLPASASHFSSAPVRSPSLPSAAMSRTHLTSTATTPTTPVALVSLTSVLERVRTASPSHVSPLPVDIWFMVFTYVGVTAALATASRVRNLLLEVIHSLGTGRSIPFGCFGCTISGFCSPFASSTSRNDVLLAGLWLLLLLSVDRLVWYDPVN